MFSVQRLSDFQSKETLCKARKKPLSCLNLLNQMDIFLILLKDIIHQTLRLNTLWYQRSKCQSVTQNANGTLWGGIPHPPLKKYV